MNADMLFQTAAKLTSGMKAGSSQSLNDLVSGSYSSSGNSQQESFKSEMDKAFDRKNNNTKPVGNSGKDKLSRKDAFKQDPKRPDVEDASSRQQELAAAQTQVQNPVDENKIMISEMGDVPQAEESGLVQLLAGQNVQIQGDSLKKLTSQLTKAGEEQLVSLPFQSNIDTVKSALLKEAAPQQSTNQTIISQQAASTAPENTEADSSVKNFVKGQLMPDTKSDSTEANPQEVPLMVKPELLDPSKVNIKVADAPVDTTQSNLADQMADKIIYKMNEGKQEFDLQLNPKELGKLNIKLTFENGSAQVLITCSNSKAQNMIALLTDNIRGILEANTGLTSTVHLKQEDMLQSQYDQDSHNREGSTNQNGRQEEKEKASEDLSFVDKLRLGLIDSLGLAG
ncbi:flagellar hook-length control protein FliK [Clostridium aminobutyricum]|uniref:Flagellar hook-length control protein FliK n=1 Tax=Clostridium aminobutyricum TaxID=33953 RepID=A0A939D9Y2_CLOAM|nr:flagellar hook-length control protein FliK [Clostridium aminobutyricum]MBN7773767.1 flagellar hook-length control protein FliK [Clostridium aminobutyricum]